MSNSIWTRFIIVGMLLIGGGVLFSCGDSDPILVGVVGQLSGRRSEIGVAVRNAVLLRADELNEAGGINGRPIKLVIKDNMGDAARCSEVITNLIDSGVSFIIGPNLSQMAEPTIAAVTGRDVLLISPTMSTDYLSGRDDGVFRISSTTARQSAKLVEYAKQHRLQSVAVVFDKSNGRYTESLYLIFKGLAEPAGIRIPVVLSIDKTGHPDMYPLALQVAASGADGVLLALSSIDAANFAQQFHKVGASAQLMGVSWTQTDDLIMHGGHAVAGMVLVSTRNYGKTSSALKEFQRKYEARYKAVPSFAAARGYEGIGVLASAMQRTEDLSPTAIKKALIKLGSFNGLSGPVQFDEYGDSASGYYLVAVERGAFTPVE